ncbi:MAG TPA: nuclear transport factor 2 family protein [Stellaceae bacterium]|nr:nuclear transport factor 2 family protein [Stellaceae bacterium]
MSAELMRRVAAGFEQSDLRPLLEALHPDVIWKSASSEAGPLLRFGGTHNGRAGVTKVLATVAADYRYRRFKPLEIVESGEIVWGIFDAVIEHFPTVRERRRAKEIAFECAIRWRVRDGKILEHQAFFDTAAVQRAAADFSAADTPQTSR